MEQPDEDAVELDQLTSPVSVSFALQHVEQEPDSTLMAAYATSPVQNMHQNETVSHPEEQTADVKVKVITSDNAPGTDETALNVAMSTESLETDDMLSNLFGERSSTSSARSQVSTDTIVDLDSICSLGFVCAERSRADSKLMKCREELISNIKANPSESADSNLDSEDKVDVQMNVKTKGFGASDLIEQITNQEKNESDSEISNETLLFKSFDKSIEGSKNIESLESIDTACNLKINPTPATAITEMTFEPISRPVEMTFGPSQREVDKISPRFHKDNVSRVSRSLSETQGADYTSVKETETLCSSLTHSHITDIK